MDTRTQIRELFFNLLNNLTELNGRVYYDYMYSINENKAPFVTVITGSETYSNVSIGNPYVIEKVLSLSVIVVCDIKANYQTRLDNLKNIVEKAIYSDNTLGGNVQSCFIDGINQEYDDDREVPLAFNTINLLVTYRVLSNDIDTII